MIVSPKICCAIDETNGYVLLSRTESAAYKRDRVGDAYLRYIAKSAKLKASGHGAGEMAQWLRALTALPEGPKFNSQQAQFPAIGSVTGSDNLFWCV